MWTNLLANLMLAAGALSALVGLLDWLLSDRQKAAVEEGAYRVWDWLDDRRRIDPVYYLTSETVHGVLLLLLVFLTSLVGFLVFPGSVLVRMGIFFLTFLLSAFWVSLHYQWVFKERLLGSRTVGGFVGQALVGILLSTPFVLAGIGLHAMAGDSWLLDTVGKAIARQAIGVMLVAVWVFLFSFLAVLVVWILRILYGASEFVLRRLLEQKRGLLTATAAALGAVALLLKSFL